ncbi:hypothetical protein AtubIFM61612_001422 [Aspergillus tubingensis]|uniref:Calcineurin-like phosphoesterase domain-containing protein n=1 Tax=Aspergillus tubingensis (strain CBS 134.48) TaxID=767770 RepID=A0A1L9MYY4_ASPTC|nr:hypothetical protein ASPTUDRAFT_45623 [Aspergillus tubingensis CBS 134.48]GLA93741.1 hypothetical protein AtubIFM57143_011341 [Aspergillus tubingensis]GLB14009.1 hypothetical protein AtubIFM61612_001422 [Aspergillus tubingensis]
MSLLRLLLRHALAILLPLALTSTVYLYLYPVFHGCAFPLPEESTSSHLSIPHLSPSFLSTLRHHLSPSPPSSATSPIFRLLVLADPQLEGDTSLPKPHDQLPAKLSNYYADLSSTLRTKPPSATLYTLRSVLRSLVSTDLPRAFRAARKRLDLLGNDYYLAHIYRTMHWWSAPSHVTVLGDLVGSQWVSDGEFDERGRRYWERVFRGGVRVDDEITGEMGTEALGTDNGEWQRRVVNVVGNHDVGYAGDASPSRIERFERVFGRGDWDIKFTLPSSEEGKEGEETVPTIHLINLNSLVLDTPALSPEVQSATYEYLNSLLEERSPSVTSSPRGQTFTLLLTHLPLHKKEGICTDAPFFAFHDDDDSKGDAAGNPRFYAGGLKEQNHLSQYASAKAVLEGIFGMSGDDTVPGNGWGRKGLILTGHDHTGCDVVHFVNRTVAEVVGDDKNEDDGDAPGWEWDALRYQHGITREGDLGVPAIREVTMRSMMGEYGGYAGLLSVWFTGTEWKYEIQMCAAGVQHLWWAVHVVDVITFALVVLYIGSSIIGAGTGVSAGKDTTRADKKIKKQ